MSTNRVLRETLFAIVIPAAPLAAACSVSHPAPRAESSALGGAAPDAALAAADAASTPEAAHDDGPAARQLTAWLTVFNSGERESLRAYLDTSAPRFAGALDLLLSLRHAIGGYDLRRSESATATKAVVIAQEHRSGAFYRITVEVQDAEPHRITGIGLDPIDPPDDLLSADERAGAQLDATRRGLLIDGIARELLAHYVYLEKAQQMVAALRDHAGRGDYDAIVRGWTFAQKVTDDLQAISHDPHLALKFGRAAPEETRDERLAWLRSIHFGFSAIERMDGNVARLAIDQFPVLDDDEAREAVGESMSRIADADALLLDLRENRGGSPATVALVASYLFGPTPVHLNDLFKREDGSTQAFWTLRSLPGKRFGPRKPVYVLVSKGTFSGGEELAYDLQSLHRAKVVGETTAGGAHAGDDHALDDWFRIDVPSQRAINPITKTDWEGVGVVPDVAVPAQAALEEAHRRAVADLAAHPAAGHR